eukprot:COSAG05_NODE_1868_length_3927_cov_18.028316_4_plen_91_part_00
MVVGFGRWQLTPSGDKFRSLTTNLLLPADADQWLIADETGKTIAPSRIDAATGQLALGKIRLPVPSTVCLRRSGGGLCIKVSPPSKFHVA